MIDNASIVLTPELIGLLVNFMALIGGFIKLESRLTKLETTQDLMISGMINTGVVDRRHTPENKHNPSE